MDRALRTATLAASIGVGLWLGPSTARADVAIGMLSIGARVVDPCSLRPGDPALRGAVCATREAIPVPRRRPAVSEMRRGRKTSS